MYELILIMQMATVKVTILSQPQLKRKYDGEEKKMCTAINEQSKICVISSTYGLQTSEKNKAYIINGCSLFDRGDMLFVHHSVAR